MLLLKSFAVFRLTGEGASGEVAATSTMTKRSASNARRILSRLAFLACLGLGTSLTAATWTDMAVSWRGGTTYQEPYNGQDISKNIAAFTYASGYAYGTQFANIDYLISGRNDRRFGSDDGAMECYAVYRNTIDFTKFTNKPAPKGLIRGWGMVVGGDVNWKNDGYGSKKRMLVAGPAVMLDVPGFLNIAVLTLFESNRPRGIASRYTYEPHQSLDITWGIPFTIDTWNFKFGGYADWISSKGTDEFGGASAPEFHVDAAVMADIGEKIYHKKGELYAGLDYEYWRNKFGNASWVPGSCASTLMARVEYHF